MTCRYPGCTSQCNFERCPAHTALFTAALQACITKEEHDRLAKLPGARMLRELPTVLVGSERDKALVIELIGEAWRGWA
jgi:hypothetical protein